MQQPNLQELQQKINYQFTNIELLQKAMTHSSMNETENYERLEFLGDAILSVVISQWLFEDFPEDDEGILAKKRAKLINRSACTKLAQNMELERYISFDLSNDNMDINSTSIMSDVFESLLGSVFLDGGLEAVVEILLPFKSSMWLDIDGNIDNPKSQLQEWTQGHRLGLPTYKEIEEFYKDDRKYFSVSATVGSISTEGAGMSKRAAEQEAAKALLVKLAGDIGIISE